MIDWIIGGLLAIILLGVVLYWQLAIAEGAYLGRTVVMWLYDWFAPRYDNVKQFRPALDTVMLAMPIMKHLNQRTGAAGAIPQVLDVATGTGRMPQTLLVQKNFTGNITALDLSERMLAIGRAKLSAYADRITCCNRMRSICHLTTITSMSSQVLRRWSFYPTPATRCWRWCACSNPVGCSSSLTASARMPGRCPGAHSQPALWPHGWNNRGCTTYNPILGWSTMTSSAP